MKFIIQFSTLTFWFVFLASCGVFINNENSDSVKWQSGDKRAKGRMVYALQDSKMLIGKNEAELVNLLGKDEPPSADSRTCEIDTNVPVNIYFTVHFDNKTVGIISTDIGD